MNLLGGRRRRRGARRPKGYLAAALGEADDLRAVLDQGQHLEAQALHGGQRRGRGRRSGDGAQDLVFLGAELWLSFSSIHDRSTKRRGKKPAQRGRAGRAEPTGCQVRKNRLSKGM